MKRIFVFLVISVFLFSCATSKKQDESVTQNNQSYAFEYLPKLRGVPEKLVLESSYNYSGGRFLDGIKTKDGGYLFAGRVVRVENIASGRYSKRVGNPFVVKMGKNGEVFWKIAIDAVRGSSQITPVIRQINDHYVLLANDTTITKISKNGEIIDVLNLDFEATYMEVVHNRFVFSNANKNILSVIWTDKEGNVEMSKEMDNEDLRFYNSLKVDKENNYYAYGVYNQKESNTSGIYAYKFSKDGDIWEKKYPVSNESSGLLKARGFSINENSIAIATNKEIFVIDSSGSEKYRYSNPEGEVWFSSGKLLTDEKVLIIQHERKPYNVLLKTVSFTGEITDLSNHLYLSDSLSERTRTPRIVFSTVVQNDKDLFLAGAIASGRRESPFLRKIVIDKPAECPKVSIVKPPKTLSSSKREVVFKEKKWFEDSITFKNTGGAAALMYKMRDDENNIQLKTDSEGFVLHPGQKRTLVFSYNQNAKTISFTGNCVLSNAESSKHLINISLVE